jgi:hypothetical protein
MSAQVRLPPRSENRSVRQRDGSISASAFADLLRSQSCIPTPQRRPASKTYELKGQTWLHPCEAIRTFDEPIRTLPLTDGLRAYGGTRGWRIQSSTVIDCRFGLSNMLQPGAVAASKPSSAKAMKSNRLRNMAAPGAEVSLSLCA